MIMLCIAALVAGFVDAIAGGGGLIQTPATLIILPQYPVVTLLATIKIPSISGTLIAAIQYARKISIQWKELLIMCGISVIAAYEGSRMLTMVSNTFMKPIIFGILILVAVYTFIKKDFGIAAHKPVSATKEIIYASSFALINGFYDGFIGPGSGNFLILFFIGVFGFDFLKASGHAKFVNVATNLGSIIFFVSSGHILYHYAIPMAVCNLVGSFIGARLAILKGNRFIRVIFITVITATILRLGYDVFFK